MTQPASGKAVKNGMRHTKRFGLRKAGLQGAGLAVAILSGVMVLGMSAAGKLSGRAINEWEERQASKGGETEGVQDGEDRVPFVLEEGFLIVVEGRIGELKKLRLAIDSGATKSMVNKRIAERLSLPMRAGKVVQFDRKVEVGWILAPEVEVGPLRATHLEMMAGDLEQLTEFGKGIDGVIGLDMLRMAGGMRIDFDSKEVKFQLRKREWFAWDRATKVWTVPLQVSGRNLNVVVDTGTSELILYEKGLRRVKAWRPASQRMQMGSAGRVRGEWLSIPEMWLGGHGVDQRALVIRGNSDLPNVDGYVGLNVLNARVVEFDFEEGILRYIARRMEQRRPDTRIAAAVAGTH